MADSTYPFNIADPIWPVYLEESILSFYVPILDSRLYTALYIPILYSHSLQKPNQAKPRAWEFWVKKIKPAAAMLINQY